MAQVNLDLVYDSQYGAKFGYGAVAGTRAAIGIAVLDRALGGDYGDIQGRVTLEQNVQMPWRGHQVLALRASGGASAGGLRRRGAFFVGGLPEEQDVFRSLLARTPVSTAGVIRGYRRGQFGGRYFFVTNAEYRIPVADVDRGLGTLPALLRRVALVPYVDAGMAWTRPLTFKDVAWGVGTSLVFTFRLGYLESVSLFFDYAHGFQDETGLDVLRLLVARNFDETHQPEVLKNRVREVSEAFGVRPTECDHPVGFVEVAERKTHAAKGSNCKECAAIVADILSLSQSLFQRLDGTDVVADHEAQQQASFERADPLRDRLRFGSI